MRQDLVEFTPDVSELLHSVKDSRMISCKGVDIMWINPWGRVVHNKLGRVHVEDLSTIHDEMHQLRLVFESIEAKDFGSWMCKGNYGNKSFEMIIYGNIFFFFTLLTFFLHAINFQNPLNLKPLKRTLSQMKLTK